MTKNIEISKERTAKVMDILIHARIRMLMDYPFFGPLGLKLQLRAADNWLETAAVDGKYFYFNHDFIESLDKEELRFLMAHEILHLAYGHLFRSEGLQARLFNCAADYVINGELIALNMGKMPHIGKDGTGLYNKKYDGWSTEQVYEDLLKDQKNHPDINSWIDGMVKKMFDEHLPPNEGKEGSEPTKDGPAVMTEGERDLLKADLLEAVIAAARGVEAGKMPGGVNRLIQELTAPKMDWRELLTATLNSLVPVDYSFLKINRKGWHISAILPGTITDKAVNVVVAIDQSGSISNVQAQLFLSEVRGIMDAYTEYNIHVLCYDTQVYNPQLFTSMGGEDLREYQPKGNGGTSYTCIYDWMKENDIMPERLVNFTDGYTCDWGDEQYCTTVFILKDSKVVPPWGEYAYMD